MIQAVTQSNGRTYPAKRIFVSGVQVYPPTDGSERLRFSSGDSTEDLGEGQLLVNSLSVQGTTPSVTTGTTTPGGTTTTQATTTPQATTTGTTTQGGTTTSGGTTTQSGTTTPGAMPPAVCLHLGGFTGEYEACDGDWTLSWDGEEYYGEDGAGDQFTLEYVEFPNSGSVWRLFLQPVVGGDAEFYDNDKIGKQNPCDPSAADYPLVFGGSGSSTGEVYVSLGACSTTTAPATTTQGATTTPPATTTQSPPTTTQPGTTTFGGCPSDCSGCAENYSVVLPAMNLQRVDGNNTYSFAYAGGDRLTSNARSGCTWGQSGQIISPGGGSNRLQWNGLWCTNGQWRFDLSFTLTQLYTAGDAIYQQVTPSACPAGTYALVQSPSAGGVTGWPELTIVAD